jgi:uncharacterized protein (UPF0333 family)
MILARRGQTILEFTILLIIVMGVFIAMQFYVKRGFQGRWKSSVDDFGDQYDPYLTNANIVTRVLSNSGTQVQVIRDVGGYWTQRVDNSDSITVLNGASAVGANP